MIYHRDVLKAAALAVSKDKTRPALLGVHLDGEKAVATDGHVLIVLPRGDMSEAEFPVRWPDAELDCGPVTLDAKSVLESVKATPTNGVFPVLHYVQVAGAGETRQLRATNLDRDHGATVRDIGPYPNWKAVLPKADPTFSIGLGVSQVLKLFRALDAAGVESVKVDFRSPLQAVTLTGTCELGEVFAIIMPQRLPEAGAR